MNNMCLQLEKIFTWSLFQFGINYIVKEYVVMEYHTIIHLESIRIKNFTYIAMWLAF